MIERVRVRHELAHLGMETIFLIIKSRLPYQVEKKEVSVPEVGVSEEGVCCSIVFL